MSKHQQQIAEGAIRAVSGTRAEVAEEFAFLQSVHAKLPEGRVREQYAALAAGSAMKLAECDEEIAALSTVLDALKVKDVNGAATVELEAPPAAIVVVHGGAS